MYHHPVSPRPVHSWQAHRKHPVPIRPGASMRSGWKTYRNVYKTLGAIDRVNQPGSVPTHEGTSIGWRGGSSLRVVSGETATRVSPAAVSSGTPISMQTSSAWLLVCGRVGRHATASPNAFAGNWCTMVNSGSTSMCATANRFCYDYAFYHFRKFLSKYRWWSLQ